MVRTNKGGVWCAAVAALLSSGVAVADEKANDFYFQQNQRRFFEQAQTARTLGLGGSSIFTNSDSQSVVGNPAGLGMMKYGDISLNYGYDNVSGNEFPSGQDVNDKVNSGSLLGATPLGPVQDGLPEYGNLGIGWVGRTSEWAKDSQNTDGDGYQLAAAYGAAVSEDVSLGYSLTYNNNAIQSSNYDYTSSNGYLHTLGIQYLADSDLKLGSILAFGHGTHEQEVFSTGNTADTDQFQFTYGLGAAYVLDDTTFTGSADYTYYDNDGDSTTTSASVPFGGDSNGRASNFRLGVQQAIDDMFTVRGGYRYAANFDWDYDRAELSDLSGSAKYNAWSLGAGVNFAMDDDSVLRAIQLDYAAEYRDVGNGDWQHLVSCRLRSISAAKLS